MTDLDAHLDAVDDAIRALRTSTRAERAKYNITSEQYEALTDLERAEFLASAPIWSPPKLALTIIAKKALAAAERARQTGEQPSSESELN